MTEHGLDLVAVGAQHEVRPHLPTTAAAQLASPTDEWLALDDDHFAGAAVPLGMTAPLLAAARGLPAATKREVASHLRLLLATLAIGERDREDAP